MTPKEVSNANGGTARIMTSGRRSERRRGAQARQPRRHRLTVLGNEHAIALVLEGWAFDPARASKAAESVLPAGVLGPLILETQFHVAVRCGPEEA